MVPRRPAGVARHGDHLLRGVALCGLAFFAAVTVAQHAFVPQLDPGQHTISEYANSDWGWLMTLGFAAWALSLGATALREMLSPLPGRWVFAALLGVASLGLAITAAFATQTTAGMLPPGTIRSTGGALHDHGSGVAQVALFGAVLATALRSSRPRVLRRLAAALFISAVTLTIAFLALGGPVAGIRQRLLLLAAVAWHAALLTSHHCASPPGTRDSSSRETAKLRNMLR